MDVLSVELEVKDSVANGKIDAFVSKVRMADKEVNNLGNGSSPLNPSIDQLLKDFNVKKPLQLLAPLGPIDPSATSFAKDVKELAPNIKKARVEQEKFKAVLQSVVGLSGEHAAIAAKISSSLGLTAATLSALATTAAVGAVAAAVAYKITTDIREEAERRLKTEERIAAVYGEQSKKVFEINQSLRKDIELQQQGFEFDKRRQSLETYSPERLAELKANLERQLAAGPTFDFDSYNPKNGFAVTPEFERLKQELLFINELMNKIRQPNAAGASFDLRSDRWKKEQDEAVRKQEEFNRSVKEGVEKVNELEKTYTDVLTNLFARKGANNPFVSLFAESDKSLKILRENMRGLSRDVISEFEKMEAKANSLKLFETRLDNQLSVSGLRADARNFRNPFDPKKNELQQQKQTRDFLTANPNYLFLKQEEFEARQRDTREPLSYNGQSFEEFIKKDLEKFNPVKDSPTDRLNQNLRDQYDLIYNPRATGFDQSIADKKFITATQGVNPLELDDRNRQAAVEAREREAARIEGFERAARTEQENQSKIQAKILETVEKLTKAAKIEGIQGVNQAVEITVKDETSGGLAALRLSRPTGSDVAREYEFGGFGLAGGSNR